MGNFGGMFPMGNFQMKKKKKKDTEKHSMVVTESIQYSEYTDCVRGLGVAVERQRKVKCHEL